MADQNSNTDTEYRDFPIEGIISAPLKASAKANSAMAIEQTKFLMEFCFTQRDQQKDEYEPVMVSLEYTKSFAANPGKGGDGHLSNNVVTTMIHVPLLTLVPLNNLAVQSVKVDFDLEITHSEPQEPGDPDDPLNKYQTSGVKLFGNVGARNKTKQAKENAKQGEGEPTNKTEASLSVEIEAGPSPLPLGLTSIINAYSKAISPQEIKKKDV